jgi:hypothetical protein
VLITQDGKTKKFSTLEQAEMYLKKHEGVFYLFDAHKSFAGISVIKASNGELEKVRDVTINSK